MPLRVLYVENSERDWFGLETAAGQLNADQVVLTLRRISDPENLLETLAEFRPDVVIADVLFDGPDGEVDSVPKLATIIDIVRKWEAGRLANWAVPIIAYTGRSKGSLQHCLEHSDDLADILDKNSADYDYLAWRLRKLALDNPWQRPDRALLQSVLEMECTLPWHPHVARMAAEYGAGWNERDQISRVGPLVSQVGRAIGTQAHVEKMWRTMTAWEFVERAVSLSARGHARHVLNVFWLGYFLIWHPKLRMTFGRLWKRVIAARPNMAELTDVPELDGLSAAWFCAGVFHDVGNCVEKARQVSEHLNSMFGEFRPCVPGLTVWPTSSPDVALPEWLSLETDPVWTSLVAAIEEGRAKGKVDSGLVSAVFLLCGTGKGVSGPCLREAARASATHNLFLNAMTRKPGLKMSWDREPLACLLILCDQIQTWDRDRGDQTLGDPDRPENAELLYLDVNDGPKPIVRVGVNYRTPAVARYTALNRTRVRLWLQDKIAQFPVGATQYLEDWPFALEAEFYLDGELVDKHQCE